MDHHRDFPDFLHGLKDLQGVGQDGFPGQVQVRLGDVVPHALPMPAAAIMAAIMRARLQWPLAGDVPARPGRRRELTWATGICPGSCRSSRAQSSSRKNSTPRSRQRLSSWAKSPRNGPPSISAWMVSTWGSPGSRRDRTRSVKSWGRQPSKPRAHPGWAGWWGFPGPGRPVRPKRGK